MTENFEELCLSARILDLLASQPSAMWKAKAIGDRLGVSSHAVGMACRCLKDNGQVEAYRANEGYLYKHKAWRVAEGKTT